MSRFAFAALAFLTVAGLGAGAVLGQGPPEPPQPYVSFSVIQYPGEGPERVPWNETWTLPVRVEASCVAFGTDRPTEVEMVHRGSWRDAEGTLEAFPPSVTLHFQRGECLRENARRTYWLNFTARVERGPRVDYPVSANLSVSATGDMVHAEEWTPWYGSMGFGGSFLLEAPAVVKLFPRARATVNVAVWNFVNGPTRAQVEVVSRPSWVDAESEPRHSFEDRDRDWLWRPRLPLSNTGFVDDEGDLVLRVVAERVGEPPVERLYSEHVVMHLVITPEGLVDDAEGAGGTDSSRLVPYLFVVLVVGLAVWRRRRRVHTFK